jgi:hypothetical protein
MAIFSSRRLLAAVLGVLAVGVTVSGCSGGNRKTTVNGTVSYKGTPLSGGMLQFVGTKGEAPATATIRPDGKFVVTDIAPGEVKVSIAATPQSSRTAGGKAASGRKVTADDLPEKYHDPEKSGLRYNITPETKQLDIKLD